MKRALATALGVAALALPALASVTTSRTPGAVVPISRSSRDACVEPLRSDGTVSASTALVAVSESDARWLGCQPLGAVAGDVAPDAKGRRTRPLPPQISTRRDGTVVLRADGAFLRPSVQAPSRRFDVDGLANRRFSSMTLDWDVRVGPMHARNGGGAHSLVMVIRHDRWRGNVFFATNFLPRGSLVRSLTNLDAPAVRQRSQVKYRLQTGATYHLKAIYDAAAGVRTTRVSHGGRVVAELRDRFVGPISFPKLRGARESEGVMVKFGHLGDENGGEEATLGWEYANLELQLAP